MHRRAAVISAVAIAACGSQPATPAASTSTLAGTGIVREGAVQVVLVNSQQNCKRIHLPERRAFLVGAGAQGIVRGVLAEVEVEKDSPGVVTAPGLTPVEGAGVGES